MKINTAKTNIQTRQMGKINKAPAPEKEYIELPLDLEQVFYIGTNEKSTEFYKNSQFFVFQAADKEGTPYTFKLDIKTMRVDRENHVFYISRATDAEILITVNKKNYKMLWTEFVDLYTDKKGLGEVEVL